MKIRTISPKTARRLAICAQQLNGPNPTAKTTDMMDVLRQIRCVQMDPIRAVERTQYLVLWSRIGNYNIEDFHRLVYDDKQLFEYWAHAASFVLTDDYPLHEYLMRHYGTTGSAWSKRLTAWVDANRDFKQYVIDEIRDRGPLLTQDFEDKTKVPWASSGWTAGRSVSYMIDYLWTRGKLMVARREGLKRWWDLSERVLPDSARNGGWSAEEVTTDGVQKSLRALGVGQLKHINNHFIERRYSQLDQIVPQLIKQGIIEQVDISGWDGEWYIHGGLLPLLDKIEEGDWKPRTVLLSPFDNLIRDRDRTELMWDFLYRIEIYVPKAKRQYGYYVLPILYGDRLVGRIDPQMDRKKEVLSINNLYLEPSVRLNKSMSRSILRTIHALGKFLGAQRIDFGKGVPALD